MAMFHKHLIIRAEVLNPPTDVEFMERWMKDLIDKIGMKVLMGPFARYVDVPGNRGLTAMTIIETSHVVMHVWDETNPGMLQLDVYTCGFLDPYDVVDAIAVFEPVNVQMKYLDREHDLIELPMPVKEE